MIRSNPEHRDSGDARSSSPASAGNDERSGEASANGKRGAPWPRLLTGVLTVLLAVGLSVLVGYSFGKGSAPGAASSDSAPVDQGKVPSGQVTSPGAPGDRGGADPRSGQFVPGGPYLMGYGHTTVVANGLPEERGTAPLFTLDSGGIHPAAAAERAAKVLGASGNATLNGAGFWVVGTKEPPSPTVRVAVGSNALFDFMDPTVSSTACGPTVGSPEPAPTGGTTGPAPAGGLVCSAPTVVDLSEADAIARNRQYMAALGVDPVSFAFTTTLYPGDRAYLYVNGSLAPSAGTATLQWSFLFVGGHLFTANGELATLVKVADYPVISAREAVARLADVRFVGGPTDPPVNYSAVQDSIHIDRPNASAPPPAAAFSGGKVPWPVAQHTIVTAQLTVLRYDPPGSATLFVPAYALSDVNGVIWTVIALPDDQLDMTVR